MGYINEYSAFDFTYAVRVVLDSVIYTAVPMFVMLSGALLLGKEEPFSAFFSKRLKRVLVPFVIWSFLVYAILYIQGGGRSLLDFVYEYVVKTLTSGVYGIYWYIYLIIGLYIITPLLRKICADRNCCIYSLCFIFLFYLIQTIFPDVVLCKRFSFENFLWVGYFIAGYAILTFFKGYKWFYKTSVALLLVVVVFRIMLTLLAGSLCGEYMTVINRVLTILASILLFSALVASPVKSSKIDKLVIMVSNVSYGVYLTHFMFISVFAKLSFIKSLPLCIEPFVMVTMVLVCDVFLMYVISKTRLKRYLF